ncbi:peptide/nickel transport system substrate-binding protein [Paraburkholderia unamae]|uniref:ABC transporter substrate-binding protein n=1 Tax=Paraburkholderia unamae TaxID=219649 RepID=UPI000DC26CCB|nr:ABC transporter substrate-binding protein [Paraburkholderia unamae]RAR62591.1 peptide/nickel transport system substrate-binding protein [Paraburkholderia unamae]
MSDTPPDSPADKPTNPRRRAVLAAGAAVGVGAVAYGFWRTSSSTGQAATQGAAAVQGAQGGTLVVGSYQEPTVYDPNHQYSWETYRIDRHIYESLVAEDLSKPASAGPPPLIPALAQSWDVSDDATTFTFHLRPGVKFHDGTDFDAHAVEFNVRRFSDPGFEFYDVKANAFMKAVYGDLKSFEVLNDQTVRYTFKHPFRDFLRMLPQGNYVSGIFSPQALKQYGQDGLAEHATGTGPFRLVQRVHGEKTELARNDQYWGGRAPLERIVFRPITDDATRLAALQAGEIDILTRTPPDAVDTLTGGGYAVPESAQAGLLYLGWNFRNRFAQQLPVRQAIIQAIDREGLAKTLFKGHALAAYSILNPGNAAFDANQRDYAYDPDAARKRLADAGFKDGDIRFTIATDEANQPSIEWIQRDLAKVGIHVDILSQEWLTYTSNLPKLAPEVALTSMEWGFVTPLWARIVYQGYVVTRGGGDLLGPELKAAIDTASHEVDEAKAITAWKHANGLLQQQAATVPLVSFTRYFAVSPKVKGFNVPAQNWYDLARVSLST